MINALNGRALKILANDFLNEDSMAQIRFSDESSGRILLELDTAVESAGNVYSFAVATPRGQGESPTQLLLTGRMFCTVTWIPTEKFDSAKPTDISWWRGGAAAITDICLV